MQHARFFALAITALSINFQNAFASYFWPVFSSPLVQIVDLSAPAKKGSGICQNTFYWWQRQKKLATNSEIRRQNIGDRDQN
jgi:hypothetical protein